MYPKRCWMILGYGKDTTSSVTSSSGRQKCLKKCRQITELFQKCFLNKEYTNRFKKISDYRSLRNEDIRTKTFNSVLLSIYETTVFNFLFFSTGLLLNVSCFVKKAVA